MWEMWRKLLDEMEKVEDLEGLEVVKYRRRS